ncbi:magnesium transporter MgtC [Geothermobacter hydrogeniphilus]|uniref:Magnesium transporter MgtC n=1 Tax=Geothermobacter hydrogeniphilus TaxID=1969733 RepID=A0A2K2H713_9BACT|nr:MgtC/SapB family protein [Geothermobacter hydrogeniphilus]PNU19088.1 magnesium transporter MgtC [Geothermobacter hydrogeniphilus]
METWGANLLGSDILMVTVKLLLAALAGGMIGMERERHGRPAGLRTHILVCVASCLMMVISEVFVVKYGALDSNSILRLDPARTAAQIISGIGFLGAGVILKEGVNVRGLTTAASLWMVAALGMAFGVGLFIVGGLSTFLALMSLVWLKRFEPVIKKDRYTNLKVTAVNRPELDREIEQLFAEHRLRIVSAKIGVDLEAGEISLEYVITNHHRWIGRELISRISGMEGVRRIGCR